MAKREVIYSAGYGEVVKQICGCGCGEWYELYGEDQMITRSIVCIIRHSDGSLKCTPVSFKTLQKKYPDEFKKFIDELDEFLDRKYLVQGELFSVEDVKK